MHVKGLTSGGGGGSGLTADQETQLDNIDTRTGNLNSRVTATRAGNLDRLDAAVSSRSTQSSVNALPSSGDISQAVGAPTVAEIAAGVWSRGESAITAGIGQHIKDQLASILEDTDSLEDWKDAYPTLSGDTLTFHKSDGTTLATFTRNATGNTEDWSGGYAP